MPSFDALFLGSFVVDIVLCFITVLSQKTTNPGAIIRTILSFIFIWIFLAGGAIILARKCEWETDIFASISTYHESSNEPAINSNQPTLPQNNPTNNDNSGNSLSNSNPSDNSNSNVGSADTSTVRNNTNQPSSTTVGTPISTNAPTEAPASTQPPVNIITPYISIIQTSYNSLEYGANCNISVTVDYCCPENTSCILMLGFNTAEPNKFRMQDVDYITSGSGSYTFNTSVTPVLWSDGTPFSVCVNISDWPHPTSWTPYASDAVSLSGN